MNSVQNPLTSSPSSSISTTVKPELDLASSWSQNSISQWAIILVASYIAAQMLSDVASLKIGSIGGWAVDMGTFIYPITFTLRDVIHKLMGKRAAQTIILTAGLINLLMALYLMMSAWVASDVGWATGSIPGQDLGLAFSSILSPVWRIVAASIVAEVLSELLDTEVYQWFVNKISTQHQWARVLISNAVSIPLDSAIFCLVAFYGQMPNEVIWQIFVFNMVVKYTLTLFSIPLIYLGPQSANS